MNDEYQRKEFWDKSYERSVIELLQIKMNEELEEWFSWTHDLIKKNLKVTISNDKIKNIK